MEGGECSLAPHEFVVHHVALDAGVSGPASANYCRGLNNYQYGTSNGPQDDIGNYLGPCSRLHLDPELGMIFAL